MVKLNRPWLGVMITSLALTAASCGNEDPAGEEIVQEEDEEEEEELGPDPVEACIGTADALVHLGSSDHANAMDGLQHLGALDDMLYGCAELSGVAMWDVSNLAEPTLVRGDPAGMTSCQGLAVDKTTRHMAVARPESIEVYSLEDATAPVLVSSHPQVGVVDLQFGADGRLFAAAETSGIFAYGLQSGELVEVARASDGMSDARAIAASGSTVVVAEGRTGVRTYQLNGTQLVPGTPVGVTGTAVEVEVSGFTAYAATLEGVAQIDLTDPNSPRLSGFNASPGTAMGMAVAGTELWVSDWTGLRAMDTTTMAYSADEPLVSDPPSLLNRTAATLYDEGRVFVAHWNGVRTYAPCAANAPSLWPEVERMEFNGALVGEPKTQVIVLRNLGNEPLYISSLGTDHSMFSVEDGGFEIPAGGAAPIEVTFTPTDDKPTYANVVVGSDDPDEPERLISIAANIPRAPMGSKVEPFHDVDTNGQTWRPQDLEGKVAMMSYFAFW